MSDADALLRDLLVFTRDGEWGKGEPSIDLVEMAVIRGTDFDRVRFGDQSSVPTRFIARKQAERKSLCPNDILIETAGGTKDQPTGRTLLLKSSMLARFGKPVTCASFSRFLRVDEEKVFPPYLFWWLQYMYASGQLDQHQVQHTGVARFQYTRFAESVRVPLPPIEEQRAIAHVLGTLDDKIELNRRMNETLEEMARALFKSWFVDFDPVRAKMEGRAPYGMDAATAALFPDSFEDSELGPIPKGWRVGRLAELCAQVENGGTPKRNVAEYWMPREVRWLTSGEVRQRFIVDTENQISALGLQSSSAKMWPAGTTVVALYGATAGEVTMCGVELCANQACCGLIPQKETRSFLYQTALQSSNRLASFARGSAQQNLSQGLVAQHRIVDPGPELRHAFEAIAAPLHNGAIGNIRESMTLAALRDALLPKLLSGQLRIRDAANSLENIP